MKRISQRDIARQQGINVSTVSRALRGGEGVSSELRQRIMQLADEQGYRPNPFAVSYMSDWVSEMLNPRLSFVKQNLHEIGKKAFRLLLDQMAGDDSVQRVVVSARLELRDSTKKTNTTPYI